MGKIDPETENYGVTQNSTEKVKELTNHILNAVKGISGVNTIDTVLNYNPYNFTPTVNLHINGVLTPIYFSLEIIQNCINNPNKQFSEKIIEVICDEVKEFISTGKVQTRKTIVKKVEEVDGNPVLNFSYEDGTPLIAK